MLDPRRLRVLVEVGRLGSIVAAAESLSFVPSAISQQIAALERELGVQLTTRVGRGIALTTAGQLLVERAAGVLLALAEAEEEVTQLGGLGRGRIRMAAFASGAPLVAGALAVVARGHPGVALTLVQLEPADALLALQRHEADVAVVHRTQFEPAAATPGLVERQLLSERLLLAVARDHPLVSAGEIVLERFADAPWVLPSPRSSVHLLTIEACRSAGFEPDAAYTADDPGLALGLVAAGLGVTVIPQLTIDGHEHSVSVRTVPGAPARQVLVAWRADDRSETVALIVELLARQAEALAES